MVAGAIAGAVLSRQLHDNRTWDRATAIAQIAWPLLGATLVWVAW
jgi:hypothetical protein